MTAVHLHHGRSTLALHLVRDGDGPTLLLLHGLGEHTPAEPPAAAHAWPGPIFGLDFTGHGESTIPGGGGYTAEMLLGDADAALGHLGSATVLGRGLGAYIALLLSGARAAQVAGAVLVDGPGINGGGSGPTGAALARPATDQAGAPDPFALLELARDVRPPDYAMTFVHLALAGSPAADPITVAAMARPDWLVAVRAAPGVVEADAAPALEALAAMRSSG